MRTSLDVVASLPFLLALSALASAPARSATADRKFAYSASDACQPSLPTMDAGVRPRASGYRNEGTTTTFVICGLGGYQTEGSMLEFQVNAMSVDGVPRSMDCTATGGIADNDSLVYSTKVVDIPASGIGIAKWDYGDFGGFAGTPMPYSPSLNLSVTCALAPGLALLQMESVQRLDAGN
jgi:hypothetical protein